MSGAPPATMQTHMSDHLSQRHFNLLARFVETQTGIKMPPSKITMMEGRLRRRVRATGHATLRHYCEFLFEGAGLESETVHLINAITTNKTEFFREAEHFRFLIDHAVPKLLSSRSGQALKLWSAACSIGAEPYTLAMVLDDLRARRSGPRYAIFASDISTDVLQTAIDGIYPAAMAGPVPPALRQRYVMRAKDPGSGLVRIAPELREMVQFARINLMEPPYPIDLEIDVIFCRNILIYFDKPTQQAVLSRLCGHLRPGGYLFLGHSETLTAFDLPLTAVGPTVFLRT